MDKCSVFEKPHFICTHLIISNVSCFDVKSYWLGRFKDVSSVSDLCLSGNMVDLLDEFTGFFYSCLEPEPGESLDDVSNESSEDDEDEESDKIAI